jgi:regulator of RNase E activity RraA
MDVYPGEIIHMDENGACKFPVDKLEKVVTNLALIQKEEQERMETLSQATTSAEIRAIFAGKS